MHIKANGSDPFVNQPSILARAQVTYVVDAAWEDEILHRTSATVEPCQQSLKHLGHEFELDWPLGLLLHDGRPVSDRTTSGDIANLHFDNVAAPQLAVDGQIEKCPVSQSSMFVEKEADCPNVARLERTFCANHIASVPRTTPMSVGIKIRNSHYTSPLA